MSEPGRERTEKKTLQPTGVLKYSIISAESVSSRYVSGPVPARRYWYGYYNDAMLKRGEKKEKKKDSFVFRQRNVGLPLRYGDTCLDNTFSQCSTTASVFNVHHPIETV